MLQFSQAIYFSSWYKTLKINGKDIGLLIMGTQKDVCFTIGDMIDVNMQAYVTVSLFYYYFSVVGIRSKVYHILGYESNFFILYFRE